jgi:hypothetical protein
MSTGTCPDCFSGTISTGAPTGAIATIHDLPTSFGYTLPNSQVLADQYAKKGGFLVYVPDLMGGEVSQHKPASPTHKQA